MNKPRDVQVFPLAAETTIFRSRTWDRLKFEIEYGLQRGTTANSYLIQAQKTAVAQTNLSGVQKDDFESRLDNVLADAINKIRISHGIFRERSSTTFQLDVARRLGVPVGD